MRKINDTTFEEDAIVEEIPQRTITATHTLDGVLADITGLETYITNLEADLVKAQAGLLAAKNKRNEARALGIKTKAEKEAELEEEIIP